LREAADTLSASLSPFATPEPSLPLFLCPNDNSQMQKISREGVDIDICPSCKGVWLDRGELDKLLVAEREESEKSVQAHRRFQEEVKSFERNPDDWKRSHKYDDERKRYRYDGDDDDDRSRHRKRRGGFDLFDIFD
jgi:Zn-finger nucleic acid-binding protein